MNGAVSSLPGPGMVEVEKECDILGSPQLSLQADHSRSCFGCRREHLLPQNHDSHGGKSHFLLQQQSSLKTRVVTDSPQNGLFCSLSVVVVVVLALMTQLCFPGY